MATDRRGGHEGQSGSSAKKGSAEKDKHAGKTGGAARKGSNVIANTSGGHAGVASAEGAMHLDALVAASSRSSSASGSIEAPSDPKPFSSFDILDSIRDAVVLHDLTGRIRFVNMALCRLLGYARDEVLQENLIALAPELSESSYLARLSIAASDAGVGVRVRLRTRRDEEIAVEGEAHLVRIGEKLVAAVLVLSPTRSGRVAPHAASPLGHDSEEAPSAEQPAGAENALGAESASSSAGTGTSPFAVADVPTPDPALPTLTSDLYRTMLATTTDGFWVVDAKGRFLDVNDSACRMLGRERDELLGRRIGEIEAVERQEDVQRRLAKIRRFGHDRFRTRHRHRDGSLVEVEVSVSEQPGQDRYLVFVRDITQEVLAERVQELSLSVFDVLNRPGDWKNALRVVVGLIHQRLKFPVVALRLREGNDYPYFVHEGLSDEAAQADCALCGGTCPGAAATDTLGCSCGLVLEGRTEPDLPFFSPDGSFWTNDLPGAITMLRELNPAWFDRDYCFGQGFRSLALIPVRTGPDALGLLEIADRQPDRFSHGLVHYLEGLAGAIGMAVARKQAEEGMNRYLKFQLDLLDRFPVIVWRSNRDGGLVYVNATAREFLGVSADAPLDVLAERISSEDRERVLAARAEGLRARRGGNVAYGLLRADGSRRMAREQFSPIQDPLGQFAGLIGAVFDETETIESARKLSESEERFRVLFEEMVEGMVLGDFVAGDSGAWTDYRILDINPAFTRHTGLDRSIVGKRAGADLGEALYLELLSDVVRTGSSMSFEAHLDRLGRDLRISAFALPDQRFAAMVEDITERRTMERATRRSETLFRQMVDQSPIAVQLFDATGRLIHANRAAYALYGISDPSAVADFNLFADPAFAPHIAEKLRRGESTGFEYEVDFGERARLYPTLKRGRAQFEVIVTALETLPIGGRSGGLEEASPDDGPALFRGGYLVQTMDATDRRRAEDNLRRYEYLTSLARDIILLMRRDDGSIVEANRAALEAYGYDRSEMLTLRIQDLKQSAILPADGWSKAEPRGGFLYETIHRRKNGTSFPVEVSATGLDLDGERHILAIVRDITERRRSERAVLQTEKLAALGRLAAATAHEMNQPLNAIKNYCQGILFNIQDRIPMTEERLKQNLGGAVQQVDRMAEIIRNMRIFAREEEPSARVPVVLQRVVAYPGSFLAAQFRSHGIDLVEEYPEDPVVVLGLENRLQQVFINLMINARDAIQERIESRGGGRGRIAIAMRQEEGNAVITITDNGPGISAEARERIFEPFFTTKDSERGTGLGLSICYEIVHQHGGEITVEDRAELAAISGSAGATDEWKGGALFRVTLPVWKEGFDPAAREGR